MLESKYDHVRTYGRGLERLLARTYGQGSCTWLGRNGETVSSSCSWGANRLGRNGMRRRVHREGLDGTGDGNEAWRTVERRKRTSYGRNSPFDREGCGVPQNGGNGPPTVETGGPVDREGCGVPQNGGNGPPTVETGVLLCQDPDSMPHRSSM